MIRAVAKTETGRVIYGLTLRGLGVISALLAAGLAGAVLAIVGITGLHDQVTENHRIVRASAQQRVSTVEQRCHLTELIKKVLAKDDPQRLPAFQASYVKCEQQLAMVRKIAVNAE